MYLLPEAFGSGQQSPEDPLRGGCLGLPWALKAKGRWGLGWKPAWVAECGDGLSPLLPVGTGHAGLVLTFTRRAAVVSCGVGKLWFSFVLAYVYSLQLMSYFYGDLF